jgi:hypothetical protein
LPRDIEKILPFNRSTGGIKVFGNLVCLGKVTYTYLILPGVHHTIKQAIAHQHAQHVRVKPGCA